MPIFQYIYQFHWIFLLKSVSQFQTIVQFDSSALSNISCHQWASHHHLLSYMSSRSYEKEVLPVACNSSTLLLFSSFKSWTLSWCSFSHILTERKILYWKRAHGQYFNLLKTCVLWRHQTVCISSLNDQKRPFLRHLASFCLFPRSK